MKRQWFATRFATAWLCAGVVLGSASFVSAQAPGGASASPVAFDRQDISGIWTLAYDGRRIPPAVLAAGVTRAMRDEVAKKDQHAIRYCNLLGIPVVMDNGRPINIVQGRTQINITPEMNTFPRYFYFRPAHIPSDVYDPSVTGDSIARWDGDALIVDTVGFKGELGIVSIPGGGFRTEDTHLIERYRLVDANLLSVTFTWIDPKVFRTPHTYEFRYTRLNAQVYGPQAFPVCNPYDQVRTAFVEGPLTPANQPLPAPGAPAGRGAPAAGGRQGTPAAGRGGAR